MSKAGRWPEVGSCNFDRVSSLFVFNFEPGWISFLVDCLKYVCSLWANMFAFFAKRSSLYLRMAKSGGE